MFGKKRPYSCLVYPRPHPSLFPVLQPEQRDFLNRWRHVLDQPPPTAATEACPAIVSLPGDSVEQPVATDPAAVSPSAAVPPSSLSPTDTVSVPGSISASSAPPTPPPAPPAADVTSRPLTRVGEVSVAWLSLAADTSLPVIDAVTSFCSQLRELLLRLHRSHTSSDCLCVPSLLDELNSAVLRTRAQLRPRRSQQQPPPSDPSTPSLPFDRHIQLQILLRLALSALPRPQSDTAAMEDAGASGGGAFECDSEQLVELFELLQSIGPTAERDALTFFRAVVVPHCAATQADAIRRVCAELDWALPLELRDVQGAAQQQEEAWVDSEEEDLDEMLSLHPVRLTRTEVLPTAAVLAPTEPQPQLLAHTLSSASSTTARTCSLPRTNSQPIRRSSLPSTACALPPLLNACLYPPSATASAALSVLRKQRMSEQLRHQEQYDNKWKRAREGITEDEEAARQQRRKRDELQALTKVERFVSNKVRIVTRLPAAATAVRPGSSETPPTSQRVTALKRRGVRQLNFAAHGESGSSGSMDSTLSSARSSSLASASSSAPNSEQSASPAAAAPSGEEFVAETPMTRGGRRHGRGSTGRPGASSRAQQPGGGRSKRNLASLLESQAVT